MIVLRIFLICLLFSGFSSLLPAQGDVVDLTKNFQFRDGIYYSFGSFRANRPDLTLDQLKTSFFTNPQNYLTRVAYIQHEGKSLNLDQLWGICLDGLPYVRLPKEAIGNTMTTFAGLLLRGKICYFSYEREEEREFPMSAYNPLTRKPFRTTIIKRKVKLFEEKLLNFETGEIVDFTLENLKKWIADDEDIAGKLAELAPEKAKEELLQILIDYVDRNIVFVQE